MGANHRWKYKFSKLRPLNIIYLRVDALHYILRGNLIGVVTLRASARRASGRVLQSQSHSIQVYAPLQLQPKLITLIPNSIFQVLLNIAS